MPLCVLLPINTQRHNLWGSSSSFVFLLSQRSFGFFVSFFQPRALSLKTLGFPSLHYIAKPILHTATATPLTPNHGSACFISFDVPYILLDPYGSFFTYYELTWPSQFVWLAPPRCQGLHDHLWFLSLRSQTCCWWPHTHKKFHCGFYCLQITDNS